MFVGVIRSHDADDDDDPPCATGADTVCEVESAGETGIVVCSANLTFFMFGSASDLMRFRDSSTDVGI